MTTTWKIDPNAPVKTIPPFTSLDIDCLEGLSEDGKKLTPNDILRLMYENGRLSVIDLNRKYPGYVGENFMKQSDEIGQEHMIKAFTSINPNTER